MIVELLQLSGISGHCLRNTTHLTNGSAENFSSSVILCLPSYFKVPHQCKKIASQQLSTYVLSHFSVVDTLTKNRLSGEGRRRRLGELEGTVHRVKVTVGCRCHLVVRQDSRLQLQVTVSKYRYSQPVKYSIKHGAVKSVKRRNCVRKCMHKCNQYSAKSSSLRPAQALFAISRRSI